MRRCPVNKLFIHFIRNDKAIVLYGKFRDASQTLLRINGACRIVRRIDQDNARFRRDRALDLIDIEPVVGSDGDEDGTPSANLTIST